MKHSTSIRRYPTLNVRLFAYVRLIACVVSLAFSGSAFAQVSFNNEIRPILSQHCTACHGPDETSREGGLRLDTFEGATESAIDPGDPDYSDLIERVTSPDDPMPPAEHGDPLTDAEVELLRKWISEGAKYETHWSFVKPVQPIVPKIKGATLTSPVDLFVLQKIRQELKTEPGPQAEPARLIRRVALDLTGLPPAREMVDSFVADPSDANYESIVDQLLSDQAFGEHWASMWLDLARYADTVGYASDENRNIWPWRDWLIRALNENKPFDQFTTEVLAGDLLPNATEQQRLATAFHRNTLNNNEGGTNDEEFRTIAVKDRISTTLNTWMGLTVRCAECHSHKYDPINHKEYHQFLDFFNQTADADRGDEYPLLELPAARSQSESIREKLAELQRQTRTSVWEPLKPVAMASDSGTRFQFNDSENDYSVLATGPNPATDAYRFTYRPKPGFYTGLKIELLPSAYHNKKVGRDRNGAVVMTQVDVATGKTTGIQKALKFQPVKLSAAVADYAQPGFGPENLIRESIFRSDEKLGWAVQHPSDGFHTKRFAIVEFAKPLQIDGQAEFKVTLRFNSKWLHSNAGRLRISTTQTESPVAKFESGELDPVKQQIQELVSDLNQSVRVPILDELPPADRRTTQIMKRGNYKSVGDAVTADTPTAFHAFPEDAERNRLGVARWLIDSENPLTARVTVNRYWARLFGRGIVVTEEDFGNQGTPPSHPELLDWLATDFQTDWDVKRALRQMVMSRTYRQNNKATLQQIKADPNNVYLARGPRIRLPAETIRDQALAVSGLLSRKMYGPPVYPPNPIKKVVNAFAGERVWDTSTGEDRYRRSLYTFLKRSQPHPLFETFDTSTRDVCSLRRINTNTPLQSFMTLNDVAFVEAAQALAMNMNRQDTTEQKIKFGLKTALFRASEPAEVELLIEMFQLTKLAYQFSPEKATLMIGEYSDEIPDNQHTELAALTVVANVILNLDEFLTH